MAFFICALALVALGNTAFAEERAKEAPKPNAKPNANGGGNGYLFADTVGLDGTRGMNVDVVTPDLRGHAVTGEIPIAQAAGGEGFVFQPASEPVRPQQPSRVSAPERKAGESDLDSWVSGILDKPRSGGAEVKEGKREPLFSPKVAEEVPDRVANASPVPEAEAPTVPKAKIVEILRPEKPEKPEDTTPNEAKPDESGAFKPKAGVSEAELSSSWQVPVYGPKRLKSEGQAPPEPRPAAPEKPEAKEDSGSLTSGGGNPLRFGEDNSGVVGNFEMTGGEEAVKPAVAKAGESSSKETPGEMSDVAPADVYGWSGSAPSSDLVGVSSSALNASLAPSSSSGATSSKVDTWSSGYFPTVREKQLLGGDYSRSGGYTGPGGYGGAGSNRGPDFPMQSATGLYQYDQPYLDNERAFYDRYPGVFKPLERGLGFFSDHDAFVVSTPGPYSNGTFVADGSFDLFTRDFDPDRAHVKVGTFYLDFLSMGAGVMYSDYDGVERFRRGEEDGWLGFVELSLRSYFQITDNFYLSAAGTVIYLPVKNRLGFRLGTGGEPTGFMRLNYEDEWGPWDLLVYDEVGVHPGFDIFHDQGTGAYQRAGRYYYGFQDTDRSGDFFSEDSAYLSNVAAAEASRPVGTEWRLWLDADRRDSWRFSDFSEHTANDRAGALLGYEGIRIPFSPFVEYDVYARDNYRSYYHTVYGGIRGRITENLSMRSRTGYLWSVNSDPERDTWLWEAGLDHNLTERTRQSVFGGQDFVTNDLTGESGVSNFINYTIQHQITERLRGSAFFQYSDDDGFDGSFSGDRELYSASLSYDVGDFSNILGTVAYERRNSDGEGSGGDEEKLLYRIAFTHRLLSRTTFWAFYEFEDANLFDEHLYALGLRVYF